MTLTKLVKNRQINLHFEHMAIGKSTGPVALKAQKSRLDFIQYCLNEGKALKDPLKTYEQYRAAKEQGSKIEAPDESELTPGDNNRRKLSVLFAHLSAFHYDFGSETIEPIPLSNLIEKMNIINEMGDAEASEYLNKLMENKIPECADMSLDDFLDKINKQYSEDGVNFHCYLRENFFTPLKPENVKEAGPALNYFMPTVFCQQHITSCEITTTLTLLKKALTNFDQLQQICLKNKELPPEVIEAQKEIKLLEKQFQSYLQDPSSMSAQELAQLNQKYHTQVEKIQVHLEVALKDATEPEQRFFKKQHKNHLISAIRQFFTTGVITKGTSSFFAFVDTVKEMAKDICSKFQSLLIGSNFEKDIDKKDIVKCLC